MLLGTGIHNLPLNLLCRTKTSLLSLLVQLVLLLLLMMYLLVVFAGYKVGMGQYEVTLKMKTQAVCFLTFQILSLD